VTQQELILADIPMERLDILTREELVVLLRGERSIRLQLQAHLKEVEALNEQLKQKSLLVEDQLITVKNKLFGKSSERTAGRVKSTKSNDQKRKKVQLPSERYPNAPLIERHITLDNLPKCKCCEAEMPDSGMMEESEYLTKVPSQYYVVVQLRHKYACKSCHGDIVTAPAPPRVTPGGAYSDELLVDVAMSKYCDLIPIERQARMAARDGFKGIPPQSLIEGTHQLADYVKVAYRRLRAEMLQARVWLADETPHRMLEGDKKNNWFLWGFSTKATSYFECHDTRSGDVASDLLSEAKCEYLASDVYSGYAKAVGVTNAIRKDKGLPLIQHVYCNAHARRKFREALDVCEAVWEKAKTTEEKDRARKECLRMQYYLQQYRKIYRLEKLAKKYPDHCLRIRKKQVKYFEKVRDHCMRDVGGYSEKSKASIAMRYFLKNYDSFTRFIENVELPIDNNQSERLLRSPVIGRKTWYGTHSQRGAETAAILFSIVESCKLNGVNPRQYLRKLLQDLHTGLPSYTPAEYKAAIHKH
jgi:transposase